MVMVVVVAVVVLLSWAGAKANIYITIIHGTNSTVSLNGVRTI